MHYGFQLEQYYLDSVANEPVYTPWLFFGQKSWTLSECQDSELKLGLDLQGGMNVTLEISMKDILMALSDNSIDPIFNQALQLVDKDPKSFNKINKYKFDKLENDILSLILEKDRDNSDTFFPNVFDNYYMSQNVHENIENNIKLTFKKYYKKITN